MIGRWSLRCGLAMAAASALASAGAHAEAKPSRAAEWLLGDGVQVHADLVNTAAPGKTPAFRDCVGAFEARADERALVITGSFPKATVWRFDLTSFDGRLDMARLYVPYGFVAFPDPKSIHTRRIGQLLGDPAKGLTHTGPWEIFNGDWKVPTARVALDGRHVYTSWFDLPGLADQQAGRAYASFALRVDAPGTHSVRVSFDDFRRHTRWRAGPRSRPRPEVTVVANPLRPHDVGSIAIGIDERVADLRPVPLRKGLVGKHPRLGGAARRAAGGPLGLDSPEVRRLIEHLDPDRGDLWEYSDDAESMASGNDMDAGRKGLGACRAYDALVAHAAPQARKEIDAAFRKRFAGLYDYFVFQRNYNATGYAQNHFSKAVWALLGAGLVWDGPEADTWRNWAVMSCRKRVELLGRDGGLEWMNESRNYGLDFWETARRLIRQCTGVDLAVGPFFDNEWRYALHNAPEFPADRVPLLATHHGTRNDANLPLPDGVTPDNTPTNVHFDDCDQVFMRTGWSADACRVRLLAGSVFGKLGTPKALRYNWAHCQVNRGSFVLYKGAVPILFEPGRERTYRKGAGNNNCILVNDTDQWGGGQVWHPRLGLDQVGSIAFFADGRLLSAARADLKNAYPPQAKVRALSRVLVHLKPDQFLLFDRLETDGPGSAQWRFHAAFVTPDEPPGRFTACGWRPNRLPRRQKPTAFDQAFAKVPDAACQVAFLAPAVTPRVAMSDVYFRWSPFRQPTRHLRVEQAGKGPLTLLTAFAPKLRLEAKGAGAFTGRDGNRSWIVLAGAGSAGDLRSQACFAAAAVDARTDTAEVCRFGPGRVEFRSTALPDAGADTFATFTKGALKADAGKQGRAAVKPYVGLADGMLIPRPNRGAAKE